MAIQSQFRSAAPTLMMIGVVLLVVADVLRTVEELRDDYGAGGFVAALIIPASLLIGAAALDPTMTHMNRAIEVAPLGIACGLGAGLCWALGTVVQKRTDWAGMGLSLTAWQIALSLPPILVASAIFADWVWIVPSWTSVLTTIYIALIPMCVGTATWFAIVGLLPANVAALSSIVVPIVAMVSGRLVLDEPLGAIQISALTCSVIALALALFKPATQRTA